MLTHFVQAQAVGLFVYPLDECTTVVGFEAAVSRRAVTVQIKDKAKIDDTYFNGCSLPDGRARDGSGRIMMDEDLERIVFVANLGMIPPLESVSIFISTSSELQTLPSGAVRVLLPAVCVPRVPQAGLENTSSLSSHQLRTDKHYCGSGSPEQGSRFCLAQLLESEATNPFEYDFSFHLEIRGPCLLAGVESPTHEIRADADPSARSAKSIVITLANKHTFDRPVEILIHPSEPHMPHILMEEGDMTPAEYERHLKGKNDFIKGTKKDPSAEKKTEIIRKRLNKDIPHHPVIMLNFCPDLRTLQPDLQKAQGEFIFLIDRSRSMNGVNINRVKDALLVILKSLMPACLFNIIGFGSTFKTLFPASQTYCEESLAVACESIKRIRADMGGTNILSPLKWVIRQPIHRGHPRLLFLLTDGAISNTGKVLELLRNHSCSTRRRAYSTTQIADHEPCKKVPTASDPGTALVKNPLRKTHLQDLQQVSPEPWQVDFQPGFCYPSCCEGSRRLSQLPVRLPGLDIFRGVNVSPQLVSSHAVLGRKESAQHPSFAFETETSSDWEPQDFDFSAARGSPHSPRTFCKAVVKGLRSNEPVQWEVAFDIRPLFQERESQTDGDADLWSETFHHLAAKSVIRDFEQLAEKECEIEHGSGRRYQVNAVHTSKACNVISKYTAFMPVDLSTNAYLPTVVEYTHTGNTGPMEGLTFNKTRLLTRAAKGFMSKSPTRVSEASSEGDNENIDYLPLASLQLACGAFLMNSAFCDAVNIPMEKLKWTSPFACHRLALSPSSSYSTKKTSSSGDHKSLSSGQQLLVPDGTRGKSPTTRDIALCAVPERPGSHRDDAGRLRHFSGSAVESISKALKAEKELSPPAITIRRFSSPESTPASAEQQADSGQGSETDSSEVQALLFDIELQQQTEPEGMLWATAVALAWLEHSSASYFIEWELVAAKASLWLSEQDFPEGYSLATVKAAAQQLFVLLRHWDENLEFNLLCYNPSSV
ncbi:von willebrand factor a domain-containing protein 5b1 [Limosa lapponica baueri]|uniref:von willebrand factor a domain-containing protein 5b1 n=1 Tax=Limosa lapponica baueri TaxID=1758121 RepID=A0A2I0TFN2_LIMLA|nr:von willebrand factor a domain-containing protein 5b1 [Limosa lapponica baueri]